MILSFEFETGEPCDISECPPGLFVTNDGSIGFCDEYGDGPCNCAGEYFHPREGVEVVPLWPIDMLLPIGMV